MDSNRRSPHGSETILLVEDDEAVRQLAELVLQNEGYEVLAARDGREGLRICEEHEGQLDLLLTDMGLPALPGQELAKQGLVLRPQMKVLFISGYLPFHSNVPLDPKSSFLAKPFSPHQLTQKIREVLDSD